jgi:hypothetical protein
VLKEKGFDEECRMCVEDGDDRPLPFDCGRELHKNSLHPYYSAPEQWVVVEWLFLKHRLDIIVKYPESNTNKIEGINSVYYDLEIYKLQGGDAYKVYKFIGISDKKQVAYSAAFDYILTNNLI